jgi:hypothetical protein
LPRARAGFEVPKAPDRNHDADRGLKDLSILHETRTLGDAWRPPVRRAKVTSLTSSAMFAL